MFPKWLIGHLKNGICRLQSGNYNIEHIDRWRCSHSLQDKKECLVHYVTYQKVQGKGQKASEKIALGIKYTQDALLN